MKKILELLKNPFIQITLFAFVLQTFLFAVFYALPDPLGLSMTEMFSGRMLWQFTMTYGAILALSALFAFAKAPRALSIFYVFYFFFAIVDYEVFRFTHQRLSYSYLRTYFHWSNVSDTTTTSTLGGEPGTILFLGALFTTVAAAIFFCVYWTIRKSILKKAGKPTKLVFSKKIPVTMLVSGLVLSVIPLILFLAGTRGTVTIPLIHFPVDMRFTLGKHTVTAPILHIAAEESFEFVRDNYKITDKLVKDMDAFLPADFAKNRVSLEYPGYRKASAVEFKAKHPYNIVFIFGESFKGRIFNQMLEGDTTLAPNIWKLANGGVIWFKNAFSGGYPTVRGTMATYLGFPSHPNRDLPSFYASNHFKGFPEYLTDYTRAYVTISNPIFDHTLPFVERFYGDNWRVAPEPEIHGTMDSLGADLAIETLSKMPTDKNWFLLFNTIASHIPFQNYPDAFDAKPDDAMYRYRAAVRYTDQQLGRFFEELSKRPDYENTVVILLGDHDTPVDSIDYRVPQPLDVSASRIFMGIFSKDTNLVKGLTVREDVASQHDIGPTVMDLAQVRGENHFWGYDLLAQTRPAWQPSIFLTQNSYYLGFQDSVLVGGLENDDVYVGKNYTFALAQDDSSKAWRKRAIGASQVLRSLLRNDKMIPAK
ncbi:MAG: sulfatase-like hydrolase/transferase [Fibrobacter sp.]|nr:sulfatase-like hydrolase/transferase [Fibrobacter sp.]MDY6370240.1 sulfatase-like hydrolase/transferase [Fibrobacter sp.]MDY6389374.1 sulfatase-like hydrolase/transferase [Fibrobacter sp.]